MRLPRAIALSLAFHLAALWGLSAGRVYPDIRSSQQKTNAPPAFLVMPPARLMIAVKEKNAHRGAEQPAPADRYFGSSEVDQRAEPVDVKPLVIPERAYIERRKGKVRLRAYINEAGRVDRVLILSAEPSGIFEQAALDAVAGTVFSPARHQGIPVKTFKELEINIDPYETIRVP